MPLWCHTVLLATLISVLVSAPALTQQPGHPSTPPPNAVAASTGTATAPDSTVALVFKGVSIIDVRTGQLRSKQTVVVVGNRIHAVGSVARVRIPAGARIIKADGTYLIPGLWDMHVHVNGYPRTFYPLFIANGVTGVREMSALALDSVLRWRREILAGARVGPRVLTSGPILYAANNSSPWGISVATSADARRVIDSLKAAGADFIKVYSGHSREVYFAIAAEARRVGLPLAGHVPESVTTVEASDSGQHSIEHYLVCDTSTKAGAHEEEYGFNPRECPALATRFRRNDTWFSVAQPFSTILGGRLLSGRSFMRYWPDSVWGWAYDGPQTEPKDRSLEQWAAAYREGLEPLIRKLGKMHRAGIGLLAGTDTSPLWLTNECVPGFSLHDQLWTFVRSGLTPLEALQTATLNPALYFHATDSLGTIAPDKLADFVLLDANPLVDIYNTRRIRAVVANGRFFDRADLDALLLDVERLARSSRRKP
jgi:imidazolonepropionase-like amidohydrolase